MNFANSPHNTGDHYHFRGICFLHVHPPLKMEARSFSETLIIVSKTTWHDNPENHNLNSSI
jgi:hypothetical protein